MKKVLISLTVFIMLLMTACVNNSQHAQPKVVPLENIGLEGNLQNSDTAYSITDLTEIGIYT